MPNHIHGILIIQGSTKSNLSIDNHTNRTDISVPTLQKNSLGQIIRGFKIGVTKYAKKNNIVFQRQGRYHDRIIRNKNEYNRISHYITENPSKRTDDMFYET